LRPCNPAAVITALSVDATAAMLSAVLAPPTTPVPVKTDSRAAVKDVPETTDETAHTPFKFAFESPDRVTL